MLNEKKIRIMVDLSRYENQEGKEELKIVKYYRSDYLGKTLLENFFFTTLGYVIIVCLVVLYHMEYLLNNIHTMNIVFLAGVIIGGYVIMLTIYSIATYATYTLKYKRVRRGVHLYDKKLAELLELYGKEEGTKNQRQKNRRGDL